MSRVLIIGASGQVGGQIYTHLSGASDQILGTYNSRAFPGLEQLDFRDTEATHGLIERFMPGVIYLPASLTNVEYCEGHPEESYQANVEGVKNVVRAANQVEAKVVYFSSEYVFDGLNGPYREEDPVNPISVYALHKVIAEHYLSMYCDDFLIIRTTVVYGWERQGKNFVIRLIKTLEDGGTVRVPEDQISSPTYSPNLVEAVVELVAAGKRGVYNVVGPDVISRYAFAVQVAKIFGLTDGEIQPVKTESLGQVAKRPLKAGLVIDKVKAEIETPLLGVEAGLGAMQQARES
ncbi:SDR family oxidoreductase [Chloroflexota bacterium]